MTDVRLVDGRVHRPLGQHSVFVHQLLRFLEAVGFEGAPRLVGVVDGDEVVTYIEGHVPVEHLVTSSQSCSPTSVWRLSST